MRYREQDGMPLANNASDDMLIFTAVLGVLIGIALTVMGRMGRQMWMWVWGLGLIAVSIYMGVITWIE